MWSIYHTIFEVNLNRPVFTRTIPNNRNAWNILYLFNSHYGCSHGKAHLLEWNDQMDNPFQEILKVTPLSGKTTYTECTAFENSIIAQSVGQIALRALKISLKKKERGNS